MKKRQNDSEDIRRVSGTFEVLGCFRGIGFGISHWIKEFHEFHHTWHRNAQDLLQIKGIEEPQQQKNGRLEGKGEKVELLSKPLKRGIEEAKRFFQWR